MAKTKLTKTIAARTEKKTYVVAKNVHHNGEPYMPGDEIELTADQADALNDYGALVAVTVATPVTVPVTGIVTESVPVTE